MGSMADLQICSEFRPTKWSRGMDGYVIANPNMERQDKEEVLMNQILDHRSIETSKNKNKKLQYLLAQEENQEKDGIHGGPANLQ